MKLFIKSFLILGVCAILAFTSSRARADITGSISGVVTDPSGAVIPGVTVVATAVSTNVKHTTDYGRERLLRFPCSKR